MTDLEKMLAKATPGPWCVADGTVVWTQINDPVETSYDIGYPVAEARVQKSFWNGARWPEGQPEANARLIALSPSLAAALLVAEKALRIALDDLDEWVACKDSLEKAGFNMDDTASRADVARAALSEIAKLTGGGE